MAKAYGGKCACCGETYARILEIDHIKGDGARDRAKHNLNGNAYYFHLKKLGWPKKGLQLLCVSCNKLKRTNQFCPCKEGGRIR
jgi:hypothetical protein